jgi:hypothetical protein
MGPRSPQLRVQRMMHNQTVRNLTNYMHVLSMCLRIYARVSNTARPAGWKPTSSMCSRVRIPATWTTWARPLTSKRLHAYVRVCVCVHAYVFCTDVLSFVLNVYFPGAHARLRVAVRYSAWLRTKLGSPRTATCTSVATSTSSLVSSRLPSPGKQCLRAWCGSGRVSAYLLSCPVCVAAYLVYLCLPT